MLYGVIFGLLCIVKISDKSDLLGVGNRTYDFTVGELKKSGKFETVGLKFIVNFRGKPLKIQSLHFQVHPGSKT